MKKKQENARQNISRFSRRSGYQSLNFNRNIEIQKQQKIQDFNKRSNAVSQRRQNSNGLNNQERQQKQEQSLIKNKLDSFRLNDFENQHLDTSQSYSDLNEVSQGLKYPSSYDQNVSVIREFPIENNYSNTIHNKNFKKFPRPPVIIANKQTRDGIDSERKKMTPIRTAKDMSCYGDEIYSSDKIQGDNQRIQRSSFKQSYQNSPSIYQSQPPDDPICKLTDNNQSQSQLLGEMNQSLTNLNSQAEVLAKQDIDIISQFRLSEVVNCKLEQIQNNQKQFESAIVDYQDNLVQEIQILAQQIRTLIDASSKLYQKINIKNQKLSSLKNVFGNSSIQAQKKRK